MLQRALKLGLVVAVLALAAQNVQAGWRHHGWGGCGYGGCGYGGYSGWGCGPAGCGLGYGYGYGGWYSGLNYGWGPGAYFGAAPNASAATLVNNAAASSNGVSLTVNVPADAKVIVNGHTTTSTGEVRRFTSSGLQPAAVYRYQVRAEFTRDGKPVVEEQSIDLTTGQARSLAFQAAPSNPIADVAKSAAPAAQR